MSEAQDFTVLGKVTQPPEMGGGVQYVCMINGVKWWVPDDPANVDRQKVEVWLKEGGELKSLTPEEASAL